MPRISKESIEELRNRVNIYDLVSKYVALKKVGRNFKGLSPFKQEKTPSFFVYPDKNFYYCFSTSQGGDLFKFVMEKEGVGFYEAAELIADRFGINLKYEKGGDNRPSHKKQLFDMYEEAADWYSRQFFADNPQAEEIRKYWTDERKFSLEDAKKMRIGYSPISSEPLEKILEKYDFVPESGLFFSNGARDRRLFPRFRGRLMIPICDSQGRVIAFTARKTKFTPKDIAYEEGKYVNSPETEIFKKKSVLFNFDKARDSAEKSGFFIVVEGQLDAVRMHCSGFENTVASQGTAAGIEHFSAMARCAKKVVLLFDGDSAGRRAALHVIPLCFQAGLEPYVAVLPPDEDPDSMILNHGADSMRELVENRKLPAISFAARSLISDLPNPTPMEKRDALLGMFEIISHCPSRVLRDDYLREAGNSLGFDLNSVHADFADWCQREAGKSRPGVQTGENSQKSSDFGEESQKNGRGMLTSATRDALLVALHNESIARALSETIPDEWLSGSGADSRALKKFLALYREGLGFSLDEIDEYFDEDDEKNLIYSLSAAPNVDYPVKSANECAEKIFKKHMTSEIKALTESMAGEKDPVKLREIVAKISSLRRESRTPPAKIVE